ncbi:MAG: FecR family protein [Candidatus Polarisedimenticolia bacterium]
MGGRFLRGVASRLVGPRGRSVPLVAGALALLGLAAGLAGVAARAQSAPPPKRPIPPYLAMVETWLQREAAGARAAQAINQDTIDAGRALLAKARAAKSAAATAEAQRVVAVAEEALRKNRLRAARAEKALAWAARLRELPPAGGMAGFMPRAEGTIEIQPAGGGAPRAVTADTPPVAGPGDTIRTGKDGRADVLLPEGNVVSLSAGAAMTLAEGAVETLLYGEVRARVLRMGHKFEVRTPSAVTSVRGTDFVVREIPGKPSSVVVLEGTVAFGDVKGAKTVLVGPGMQSYLLPDGAPAEPTPANLKDMRRWWEE